MLLFHQKLKLKNQSKENSKLTDTSHISKLKKNQLSVEKNDEIERSSLCAKN